MSNATWQFTRFKYNRLDFTRRASTGTHNSASFPALRSDVITLTAVSFHCVCVLQKLKEAAPTRVENKNTKLRKSKEGKTVSRGGGDERLRG